MFVSKGFVFCTSVGTAQVYIGLQVLPYPCVNMSKPPAAL